MLIAMMTKTFDRIYLDSHKHALIIFTRVAIEWQSINYVPSPLEVLSLPGLFVERMLGHISRWRSEHEPLHDHTNASWEGTTAVSFSQTTKARTLGPREEDPRGDPKIFLAELDAYIKKREAPKRFERRISTNASAMAWTTSAPSSRR